MTQDSTAGTYRFKTNQDQNGLLQVAGMAGTHWSLKRFASAPVMLVIGIALVGLWLLLVSAPAAASVSAQVRAGVLDLTAWPIESASAARLDGEWELYWERLLDPAD